ncbi:hypothetical protein C7S13_1168 [Burkholderia cepacia]|nr:hypothetical protein [Burkholderia cepacia]
MAAPRAPLLARAALLAGAIIPWPSSAQVTDGGAQLADGVTLETAPGDYSPARCFQQSTAAC